MTGIGKVVSKSRCGCHGSFCLDCETCQGYGVLERPCGMKGACFACGGSGNSACKRCVDGVVRIVDPCSRCGGQGTRRDGERKSGCVKCGETGVVETTCGACKRLSGVLCTDFQKVVQKQAMCLKCQHFSPRHLMVAWGACAHLFCLPCLMQSELIPRELDQQRIPMCPAKDCAHELTLDDFAMLYGNGHGQVSLSPVSYSYYRDVLFTAISRKGKFRCTWWGCNEWHPETEALSLPTCGHAYVEACAKRIMQVNGFTF